MKKTRFIILLLCFCLIIPTLVACGKEEEKTPEVTGKYDYDDSSRERAADSIPDNYDLENQTIGIWWHETMEATLGLEDTTDIVYSKIYERNLSVEERLNVISILWNVPFPHGRKAPAS